MGFCFVPKSSLLREILTEQSEEKCGDLFCLYALPHFASSNWPVITNLKNIADVRYDHASNVPQRAGLWSKTSAAVRNTVPKDAKNEIVSPCVRRRTETFAASVCPRGYVCH